MRSFISRRYFGEVTCYARYSPADMQCSITGNGEMGIGGTKIKPIRIEKEGLGEIFSGENRYRIDIEKKRAMATKTCKPPPE